MMEELPRPDADAQRTLSLQARAEGRLGSILLMEKRRPEAERAYRRSLDPYRTLEPRPAAPPVNAVNGETIRLALADLMVQDGRLNWARLLLEAGIARTQKLTTGHANFRPLLLVLAEHYQALAEILTRQGESSLAAEATHKAETLPPAAHASWPWSAASGAREGTTGGCPVRPLSKETNPSRSCEVANQSVALRKPPVWVTLTA